MADQMHANNHSNQSEMKKCQNNDSNVYVDDMFGIVNGNEKDIWNKIKLFIYKLSRFYINNKLAINRD